MKKLPIIFLISFVALLAVYYFFTSPRNREMKTGNFEKNITVSDNGLFFSPTTQAATVADFLKEKNIKLDEHDQVIPDLDSPITSVTNIDIERALTIKITADGKISDTYTLADNVAGALWENNVKLGEDDFTQPSLDQPLKANLAVSVIRVDIREETVEKPIPFDTLSNEDDSLSWRTKKITQKGAKGINEVTYKVVSHDGKEISRKIISQTMTKDPTPEIVTQGTYMKLGKGKTGQGTWYAFKDGLFAASTTLPRGSYAKVTNMENGQSVVVQINDYGPFGKGRIIDLDKVAFQKIAGLGAGVIGVKVEPILN
jgi:hypothetical protein